MPNYFDDPNFKTNPPTPPALTNDGSGGIGPVATPDSRRLSRLWPVLGPAVSLLLLLVSGALDWQQLAFLRSLVEYSPSPFDETYRVLILWMTVIVAFICVIGVLSLRKTLQKSPRLRMLVAAAHVAALLVAITTLVRTPT